jgi:hypothetical protein
MKGEKKKKTHKSKEDPRFLPMKRGKKKKKKTHKSKEDPRFLYKQREKKIK